jgi:hypothetical protein
MKTNILGGAYAARTFNEADNRMVNLFPEVVSEGGKEPGYLNRTPGLRFLATVGTGPIRGFWTLGAFSYVVSANKLYKVDKNWTATLLGTVASGTDPVSMSDNGIQIFIACNPRGFIYNINTGAFVELLTSVVPGSESFFPGAKTVTYIGGYFVYNEPNTQKIWVTKLLDGTVTDPLDFASAEASTDNVKAVIVDHKEVWIFGAKTIEIWYNAGGVDYPLSPIQGAYIETGLEAYRSIAKVDNSLFWLGSDPRGDGIVYRTNGYTPVRVSNHALEYAIQGYETMVDAQAYSYQQEGHAFYVLTFPTANKTWVYDTATSLWHERASFNNGDLFRHRSNCQMYFNDEIVVGDYDNGNLYAFDLNVYSDYIGEQKWIRSWRALGTGQNTLKRTIHTALQLDCETGVGLAQGQGVIPRVALRWSDDGGHTWSNYHTRSMGQGGDYGQRVIWRKLGMTMKLRDRVYEISGTDPVKISILGADLQMSPTGA